MGAPDEARLLSSTGVSRAEMARMLSGHCLAGTVASALLACAAGDELPSRADLARAIAADGVAAVKEKVARIYSRSANAKAKA